MFFLMTYILYYVDICHFYYFLLSSQSNNNNLREFNGDFQKRGALLNL